MYYRYFTYKKRWSYFTKQLLLNKYQFNGTLYQVMRNPKSQDVYATIQYYTKEGDVIGCPIYADLDGVSALDDTRELVSRFIDKTGESPLVFYSGGKGFHLLSKIEIKHPVCHKVAQKIINSMGKYRSLDQAVYTSRRLWRVPTTFNVKGNRYKIPLGIEELNLLDIEDIRDLAKDRQAHFKPTSKAGWKHEEVGLMLSETIQEVDKHLEELKLSPKEYAEDEEMPKCIVTMLSDEPIDGKWNLTLFTLSKFLKSRDIPYDSAVSMILDNDNFYKMHNEDHNVVKVVRSVYDSREQPRVGCRNGIEGEIMRCSCDMFCHYSPFDLWQLLKPKEEI